MGIVFAPVVTVAALSISLIFMTALVNGFKSPDTSESRYSNIGVEKMDAGEWREAVAIQGGMGEIEFTKLPWWEAMDRFSRLMVNFFAVGLMRMIFFTAIKANAIGEKVGARVQEFWGNVFKTLPILPIGEGGAWVGVGSAYNVVNRMPETRVSERNSVWEAQATEWLRQWEEAQKAIETGKLNAEQITWTISAINSAATWNAKESVTKYLTEKWVTADIGTVWSTNADVLYKAINDEIKKTPAQKAVLTANANEVFGAGWYEKMATAEAKTTLEKFLAEKAPTNEAALKDLVDKNKPTIEAIEAYFKVAGNTATYETKAWPDTYIIARTETGTPAQVTYTVTKKTP